MAGREVAKVMFGGAVGAGLMWGANKLKDYIVDRYNFYIL